MDDIAEVLSRLQPREPCVTQHSQFDFDGVVEVTALVTARDSQDAQVARFAYSGDIVALALLRRRLVRRSAINEVVEEGEPQTPWLWLGGRRVGGPGGYDGLPSIPICGLIDIHGNKTLIVGAYEKASGMFFGFEKGIDLEGSAAP